MRTALVGLLALVGGTQVAQAQQYPAYSGGNYQGQGYPQQPMMQGYPQQQMMQGYPQQQMMQGYPQQQMPRTYYANGYNPSAAAQPNAYYYPSGGNYPPQNSTTPTYIYTPESRQYNQMYSMTPTARTPATPASWPAPAAKTTSVSTQLVETPTEIIESGETVLPSTMRAPVSFHRPTKDLFWASADYTFSFFRPMRLSGPLVTTGSQNDNFPGALGEPSTQVLFGNNSINFNMFSGVRLEAGVWLDGDNRFSIDGRGYWSFPNTESFSMAGDGGGSPVIARPVFNIAAAREGAFLNTLPGVLNGSILIQAQSQLAGGEFNARMHSYMGERIHADALFGFRYLRMTERLSINEHIDPLVPGFLSFEGNPVNAPNSLHDYDSFQTINQFFGAQIGGRVSYEYKWFTFEGFAKLGLGGTVEQTKIEGSTTMLAPMGNQTAGGGILALPSNIGTYTRTIFGIVPEFGVNLGVDLCQNVRLKLGYSMLMWNHVVRPGLQYDRNINPGQAPGTPPPGFANVMGPMGPIYRFNDELFWGHTFNIGVEFHY